METLQQPKETKARKEHRCSFCNEKILAGHTYQKSTHKYDGDVYDWKTHLHCAKLADHYKMYEECDEGVTMDDFMEWISEEFREVFINKFKESGFTDYGETLSYLRFTPFNKKLWFVIRNLKKQGIEITPIRS